MLDYLPLTAFKAIYVVDLCSSLCEQVRWGLRLSSYHRQVCSADDQR